MSGTEPSALVVVCASDGGVEALGTVAGRYEARGDDAEQTARMIRRLIGRAGGVVDTPDPEGVA